MNATTKRDFQAFLNAAQELAESVSAVSGADAPAKVAAAACALKMQLDGDETILD